MSPEALFEGSFTTSSDVWSFGVLMWEVFSLGQQPYQDHTNIELLAELRSPFYPQQPHRCPDFAYGLMLRCWESAANSRPNTNALVKEILHFMATNGPGQSCVERMSVSDDLILLYGQLNELIESLDDVNAGPPPKAASVCRRGSCPTNFHLYSKPKNSHTYDEILANKPAIPPRRHSLHRITGVVPRESEYLTSAESCEVVANLSISSILEPVTDV